MFWVTVWLGAAMLSPERATAQEQMRTVTDPETGCVYFLFGSTLTPRLRRDGLPDCPDVGAAPANVRRPAKASPDRGTKSQPRGDGPRP